VETTLSNALKELQVKDQEKDSQGSQTKKKNNKGKQVINQNNTNNTNNKNVKKAKKDPQNVGVSGEGTSVIPITPASRSTENNEDTNMDEGF